MLPESDYFTALTSPGDLDVRSIAERVYRQVFRTDFSAPGAALLAFASRVGSKELRVLMVALKEALDDLHRRLAGRRLGYLSMARFNQQVTTKFHLDGAPDEAYLMLGYEPTRVPSTLAIADYTQAAHDWGIEPKTLLADFNPMYPGHESRLLPYVTKLERFDPSASQVLILNNSSLPYRPRGPNTLGVMHQATIFAPMPLATRIVNSTMIAVINEGADEPMNRVMQQAFIETREIAGQIGE